MSPEQKEGKTCLKMKIFCSEIFILVIELRFQLLIIQESNTERKVCGKIKDSFIEESSSSGETED